MGGVVDELHPPAEGVGDQRVESFHRPAERLLPQQGTEFGYVVGELELGLAVLDHGLARRLDFIVGGAFGVQEGRAVAVRVRDDRIVEVRCLQVAVHDGQQAVPQIQRAGVGRQEIGPRVPAVQQGLRNHGRAKVELLVS